MRISQLAGRSGVPATTLRFYETAGLLPADRTPAGYRAYRPDALDRLRFIGAAKNLGLSLDEIGALLPVWQDGPCTRVKTELRPRIRARLDQAEARLIELHAFTTVLHTALRHLDHLPDRTDHCNPDCGFPAPTDTTPAAQPLPSAPTRADTEQDTERWRSAPVACALTGDARTDRIGRWRRALDGAVRTPIPDGVRLVVPIDRAGILAELAAAEQHCCPFLDFHLHLDGPVLRVEIHAPTDGTDLLTEVFGRPDNRTPPRDRKTPRS
ncbi:MerR family transcriptional regulator [Nocardia terpenica]|uniref:MerR family transcriptional regulator n=2 Tax=Nocardia terpenica TaxID=455432 RepID=A0A291RX49_9NOCA|nr:MerR family transcriptional regulator [Nocardia terpenica]